MGINTKKIFLFFLLLSGVFALCFPLTYNFFATFAKLHIYLFLSPFAKIYSIFLGLYFFFHVMRKKNYDQTNGFSNSLDADIFDKFKRKKWIILFVVLTIMLWGSSLRLINLGASDIYHDEIFYVSALKSYQNTGNFEIWNYATNSSTGIRYQWTHYVRLLSFFTTVLGETSPSTLRFPSALFGVMSLPLIFILTLRVTKKVSSSIMAMYYLAMNDISIYLSRFIRHYSLFEFFSILLCLYLVMSLDYTIRKKKIRLISQILIPFSLVYYLSKYIVPFALSFFPILLLYSLGLLALSAYKYKRIYVSIVFIIGEVLFFLDYFEIIYLLGVHKLLTENFSLGIDFHRISDYLNWLFTQIGLPQVIIILLLIYSLSMGLKKKHAIELLGYSFFLIPLLLLLFNNYHSHDFRYLSHIIPFFILILSSALSDLFFLFYSFLSRYFWEKFILIILLFTIFIIPKPTFPYIQHPPLVRVAQADWQNTDGERLHRRAVSPNYKKAYSYVFSKIQNGDSIVIIDGENYIQPNLPIQYWQFKERYSPNLINMVTKEEQELISVATKSAHTYLVGAYLVWYDTPELEEILTSCTNVTDQDWYFHFNYNAEFYFKYPKLGWPSVIYCTQNSVTLQ